MRAEARWLGGLALLVGGCSVFQAVEVQEPLARAARAEAVQTGEQGGMHVARHVRNTPGLVHAALWVNAGFRDATPSDVAVLTALASAEAAGGDITVRVIPDGTAFSRTCEAPGGLRDCIAGLISLLSRREIPTDALSRARRRLEAWRLAALRPEAAVDHLALTGLLGPGASWPAAARSGEAQPRPSEAPVGSRAVSTFLSAHYGPGRSALFLLGDLPNAEVDLPIADLLRGLPEAQERRATRANAMPVSRVQIQAGSETRISIFAAAPSRAAALRAAEVLRRRPPHPNLRAHTFAVRGSALIHLSGSVDEANLGSAITAGVHAVGRELLFFQRAQPHPLTPPTTPEQLARWLGERWTTDPVDDSVTRDAQTQISVAVTLGAGRSGRRERRRRARNQALRQQIQAATAAAQARLAWAFSGDIGQREFQGRSAQGAELWIQRRPQAASTAAAVAFAGGAATDPASLHGRAALLAYSLAAECESEVHGPLAVEPLVSAERIGVLIHGPSVRAADIVTWAIRCAATMRPSSAAVERGRVRLGARQRTSDARYAAITARTVSPARPGVVAPIGTPDTIADIRTDQLHALLDRTRVAPRMVAAAAGELDLARTRALFTAGLGGVPEGRAYRFAPPWIRGGALIQTRAGEELLGGVLAWRLAPGPVMAMARESRASVRAAAARLGHVTGGRVSWIGSGAWTGGGWFAVGLAIGPDEASRLPALVSSMRIAIDEESMQTERAAEANALSDPSQAVRARVISLGAVPGPAPEEPSEPQIILLTR